MRGDAEHDTTRSRSTTTIFICEGPTDLFAAAVIATGSRVISYACEAGFFDTYTKAAEKGQDQLKQMK
jgi:hypothetical protein